MTGTAAQKARRNDEESNRPVEEINSVREEDPKNYGQAMKSVQRKKWLTAMSKELQAFEDNGLITVKVVLMLALRWGVPARHGDIPNAYVKSDKEEHLDIYLEIPQWMKIQDGTLRQFGVQEKSHLALKLKKSLYGLKQAGHLWSQLLHTRLEEAGFMQSSSPRMVELFFEAMTCLSIKDLGEVRKFLGMRVSLEDEETCTVDKQATIEEMHESHGLKEENGVRAPISEEADKVRKGPVLLTTGPR
uniref:Reverse transcriptase Ty1/copia-type domain-containing protein n=1 Tax=Peronospora matthiolae TaxID=2874970 RepID=A0AAV1T074_9STRA